MGIGRWGIIYIKAIVSFIPTYKGTDTSHALVHERKGHWTLAGLTHNMR